jgi:DNA-binding XRE family transcriptional regulator
LHGITHGGTLQDVVKKHVYLSLAGMKKQVNRKKSIQKEEETPILAAFGNRLRDLRISKGYTSQEAFAYDHGFSRIQMNKWERGADIKLSTLERLAKAFGMTVQEFFGEGF